MTVGTARAEIAARSSRRVKRARLARAKTLAPDELRALKATTRRTVGRATTAIILAALILLVFNSSGLRTYARDLPASQLADRIVLGADGWHNLMRQLGATQPKAWVRQVVTKLRDT
jgi:hypothetical protein